jgi:uncharacterized protein with HEPN domain
VVWDFIKKRLPEIKPDIEKIVNELKEGGSIE